MKSNYEISAGFAEYHKESAFKISRIFYFHQQKKINQAVSLSSLDNLPVPPKTTYVIGIISTKNKISKKHLKHKSRIITIIILLFISLGWFKQLQEFINAVAEPQI